MTWRADNIINLASVDILLLQVENISFGYRNIPLFSGISLDVLPGDLVHLTGPNGSGKTTFLKVIAGLITPDSGSIYFRNGYFEYLDSESNGLYLKMSALNNLRFWTKLKQHPKDHQQLNDQLLYWGLNNKYITQSLPVENFSTGMKRKLALARVVLSAEKIWLLDEPILGLDERSIGLFSNRLKSHLDQGGGAVVISHDLDPISGMTSKTLTFGS